MTVARKGKGAPLREQRAGRVDRRSLAKVACGDIRVFTRNTAPAPNKVRVTILVDASGSMDSPDWDTGGEYLTTIAAQTCRDLGGATEMLDWVTADVVAFTSHVDCDLYPLWKSGESLANIDHYFNISMSGTEEGYAIAFALDEMLERIQSREQGLIIIISDGAPSEPKHVKSVVAMAAQHHIPVVSVALTKSAVQDEMYGIDNVVKYNANTRVLARDMARVIGRVI
jgi:uncharacterized protein with von Willebrand factor type A (vWA) domain